MFLVLDYGAMITVNSSKYGVVNCKPLRVIWGKLGEYYSEKNTIMVRYMIVVVTRKRINSHYSR